MGIPCYYTKLLRKHSRIIKSLDFFSHKDNKIHLLCIDANSLIYDSLGKMKQEAYSGDIENEIIERVKKQIIYYIELYQPTEQVYIAFDGIPPPKKMKQQVKRRILNTILKIEETYWDKTNITIGTPFMDKFTEEIERFGENYKGKDKYQYFYLSSPNENGEGEHKLMEYIRTHDMKDKNIMIYGLDSDLIMLSLLHLEYVNNIYTSREAPDFMKIELSNIKEDNVYSLDIRMLSHCIVKEIGCSNDIHRIKDYVLFCFLLGNDFISNKYYLTIRYGGYDIICDKYKELFKDKPNDFLINKSDNCVNDENFKKLLKKLEDIQLNTLGEAIKIRDRYKIKGDIDDVMLIRKRNKSVEKYKNRRGVVENSKSEVMEECKEVYKYYVLGVVEGGVVGGVLEYKREYNKLCEEGVERGLEMGVLKNEMWE